MGEIYQRGYGGAIPTAVLDLVLRAEHYAFWSQGIVGAGALKGVRLFAESSKAQLTASDANNHSDTSVRDPLSGNLLSGKLSSIPLPQAVTDPAHPFVLRFDDNTMNDLWLAVTWVK